jgi:hypothetical protein
VSFLVVDVSAAGLLFEADDELSVGEVLDDESPLPFGVPALLASAEAFFG